MYRHALSLALAAVLAAAVTPSANATSIADFFGVYVGTSEVTTDGTVLEHRHLDLEIVEAPRNGFFVRLIVVATVDGRRDVPGVERWRRELKFRRDGDGWEIDMRQSLFMEYPQPQLEEGDEVLRARIEGESLLISSEYIQSSGERVDQTFDFHLTEAGLETRYVREVDGVVSRETSGRLVRTE